MMLFIRSLLFHVCFYVWTLLFAVLLLWVFLLPRRMMVRVITVFFSTYAVMEKYIVGLAYEVRGRENLPNGACVIACKHQSAYETLKLHLLFGDVAIVLKRELMWIPFWGWYQMKAGMIPVDRGARGVAMKSMVDNARHAVEDGRRIVIFPQGTRVAPDAKRPYKVGVAVLAEKYNLPIVPVALNAGLYWPRHSFYLYPGKVIFEILPPLPAGLPRDEIMSRLEMQIEAASDRLRDEGRAAPST